MEGKKITSVNPLEGALGFLGSLLSVPISERPKAMMDKVGDITIDTCLATDTGVWETGIRRESIEGEWVIVSQYENKEEAKVGHAGWVKLMKNDPKCALKDIDMWNLGLNNKDN